MSATKTMSRHPVKIDYVSPDAHYSPRSAGLMLRDALIGIVLIAGGSIGIVLSLLSQVMRRDSELLGYNSGDPWESPRGWNGSKLFWTGLQRIFFGRAKLPDAAAEISDNDRRVG